MTDHVEPSLLPITIRPERGDDPAEAAAIADMVTAAFGSDFEGGLPAAIRASATTSRSRRSSRSTTDESSATS